MGGPEYLVVCIIAFLFITLYFEWIKPLFVFLLAALALLLSDTIDTKELMAGFSNEQIAVILLLLLLSEVIQRTGVLDVVFRSVFSLKLSYKLFLAKMGAFVSSTSAFVNNTPLTAIMLPYVYDWAKKKNIAPSKVLIPLSYATILGGMVTLVGTSTNLVVNSFIIDEGLPGLNMFDFSYAGIPIAIVGIIYLVFIASKILPDRKDAISAYKEKSREYIAETLIPSTSSFIGKTVEEAGLRQLEGLFLVEIVRNDVRIAPVSPKQTLLENDVLLFAGETHKIIELLKNNRDLVLPRHVNLPGQENIQIVESVVSINSGLIGRAVRDTNFRGKYDAAIIAINRDGERVTGKIGEVEIQSGDLLLMLAGKDFKARARDEQDFYVVSQVKEIHQINQWKVITLVLSVVAMFIASAMSWLPLFKGLLLLMVLIGAMRIVKFSELKRSFDMDLYLILVLALCLGKGVSNSNLDDIISTSIIDFSKSLGGPITVLAILYAITNILSMLVTNKAAIAIMFPVALAASKTLGIDPTPFFLCIAFAGCAEFMTPYGYQTNLMVYGPGGYKFKDYVKVGWGLSVLVMIVVVIVLGITYKMI